MASTLPSSPQNEELFAWHDSKLWAGDPKIWLLSLDLPKQGYGTACGILAGFGPWAS